MDLSLFLVLDENTHITSHFTSLRDECNSLYKERFVNILKLQEQLLQSYK